MSKDTRRIVNGALLLVTITFVAAVLSVSLLTHAWSHEATCHLGPEEWNYSGVCCNDKDCKPLLLEPKATDSGWFVEQTGETIGYSDSQIRQSKDGCFHACIFPGGKRKGKIRCLYVPGFGS